jgi:hypothetical protein
VSAGLVSSVGGTPEAALRFRTLGIARIARLEKIGERGRGSLDAEYGEGKPDRPEAVAEVLDDAAEPEQPKVAFLERP